MQRCWAGWALQLAADFIHIGLRHCVTCNYLGCIRESNAVSWVWKGTARHGKRQPCHKLIPHGRMHSRKLRPRPPVLLNSNYSPRGLPGRSCAIYASCNQPYRTCVLLVLTVLTTREQSACSEWTTSCATAGTLALLRSCATFSTCNAPLSLRTVGGLTTPGSPTAT